MVNLLWETTPELNSRLIELHQSPENYSYSQIAKQLRDQFQIPVSGHACIGRAHRIGLPPRKLFRPPPKQQRRRAAVEEPVPPVVPAASAEPTPHQNLPLIELRANHCRYPLGDFPFVFCCRQKRPSSPYCATHHAAVYIAPSKRPD